MELALSGYVKALTPCIEKFKQWRSNEPKQNSKLVECFPQSDTTLKKTVSGAVSNIFSDAIRVIGKANSPCLSAKDLIPFYDCFPKSPRKIYIDYDTDDDD